jgi:hypothetical protein
MGSGEQGQWMKGSFGTQVPGHLSRFVAVFDLATPSQAIQ